MPPKKPLVVKFAPIVSFIKIVSKIPSSYFEEEIKKVEASILRVLSASISNIELEQIYRVFI